MTAQELAQLKGLLAQGGPDFSDEPDEVRAVFDGLLDSFPVDDALVFDERTIGGIPGIWLDAIDASAGVTLYLHGGAYVVGTAAGYRGLASGLARAGGTALFSIDYRRAPEAPFPAAVDDAVAAYRGLLQIGFDAARIAIVGDSAGGGLAVSLLLALREQGVDLPAAAALLSPWTDLTLTGDSISDKADVDDSLDEPGLRISAERYLAGRDSRTPLASPLFADLTGLPPLLVEVGSSEILLDDSTRLAAKAGAAEVDVTLHVWPRLVHDWSLFSFMLSEGADVVREVGAFLQARLGGAR
jgi:acetyl esterase/lipase